MNNVEERIDAFETEDLVYCAKMSYGDMKKMLEYIEIIGEQLIIKDISFQSFFNAVQDSVSSVELEKILNLSNEYMISYTNRFTTNEMREKLEKEGFSHLNVVLVDVEYANEAIDNGREVFALKSGNMVLINKPGDATKYEEEGYLIAVTPFTYEAEFNDGIDAIF